MEELLRAPIPLHGVAVAMEEDEEEEDEEEKDEGGGGSGGGVLAVALKALKERAAVGDLLPKLVAAREELAAFLFQCPPPRKETKVGTHIHTDTVRCCGRADERVSYYVVLLLLQPPRMKEEVRVRAMTWLFVLDFVTQDVIPQEGMEKVPEEPMELVRTLLSFGWSVTA